MKAALLTTPRQDCTMVRNHKLLKGSREVCADSQKMLLQLKNIFVEVACLCVSSVFEQDYQSPVIWSTVCGALPILCK